MRFQYNYNFKKILILFNNEYFWYFQFNDDFNQNFKKL